MCLSGANAEKLREALDSLDRIGNEQDLKAMLEDPTLQSAIAIVSGSEAGAPVNLTAEQAEAVKAAIGSVRDDVNAKLDVEGVAKAARAQQMGSPERLLSDARRLASAAMSDEGGMELKPGDISAVSAVISQMEKELEKATPTMSVEDLEKAKAALANVDISALSAAADSGEPVRLTPEMAANLQEVLALTSEAAGVAGAEAEADTISSDPYRRESLPSVTALNALSSVLDQTDIDKNANLTPFECIALKESLESVSGLLSDEAVLQSLSPSERASLERANAKVRAGAASKRGAELTPEDPLLPLPTRHQARQ